MKKTRMICSILSMIFIFSFFLFSPKSLKANVPESILVRCHFQEIGWTDWVDSDGNYAELYYPNRRLEAIELQLKNVPNGSIKYQSHIEKSGWTAWRNNGQLSGTTSKSLRLEAFKISLENVPNGYSVEYESKLSDGSWTDWKKDGAASGTTQKNRTLEGIRVKLISDNPSVTYSANINDQGWTDKVDEGFDVAENNKNKITGLYFDIRNTDPNSSIVTHAYEQNSGWTNGVLDNELCGSLNSSTPIQAIKLDLLDLDNYNIDYRVEMNDGSWTNWMKNGQICGNTIGDKFIINLKARIYKDGNEPTDAAKSPLNLNNSTEKTPYQTNNSDLPSDSMSKLDKDLLTLTNEFRTLNGIKPLDWDEKLYDSANYKSNSMLKSNYFSHENPEYNNEDFSYLLGKVFKYKADLIGENLYASENPGDTAATIFETWKNSPEHRANLLNKDFHSIGISVITSENNNSDYNLYATQHFSSKIYK